MRKKWHPIQRLIRRWSRAEEGVAATEYAILLSLIIVGSITVISMIGEKFAVLYTIIAESLPSALA